jgi:hypothetical protein
MAKTINDYNSYNTPISRYQYLVDCVESRVRRISALPDSEEIKISLLKGALRSVLEQLEA